MRWSSYARLLMRAWTSSQKCTGSSACTDCRGTGSPSFWTRVRPLAVFFGRDFRSFMLLSLGVSVVHPLLPLLPYHGTQEMCRETASAHPLEPRYCFRLVSSSLRQFAPMSRRTLA